MRITNYELSISILFVFFAGTDITARSGNGSAFQAGEYSGVIVRRSQTYGYEDYCLSGKGEKSEKLKVEIRGWRNENYELPITNFRNRRIYSMQQWFCLSGRVG